MEGYEFDNCSWQESTSCNQEEQDNGSRSISCLLERFRCQEFGTGRSTKACAESSTLPVVDIQQCFAAEATLGDRDRKRDQREGRESEGYHTVPGEKLQQRGHGLSHGSRCKGVRLEDEPQACEDARTDGLPDKAYCSGSHVSIDRFGRWHLSEEPTNDAFSASAVVSTDALNSEREREKIREREKAVAHIPLLWRVAYGSNESLFFSSPLTPCFATHPISNRQSSEPCRPTLLLARRRHGKQLVTLAPTRLMLLTGGSFSRLIIIVASGDMAGTAHQERYERHAERHQQEISAA